MDCSQAMWKWERGNARGDCPRCPGPRGYKGAQGPMLGSDSTTVLDLWDTENDHDANGNNVSSGHSFGCYHVPGTSSH